jgi:hypothetical protein
VVDWRSTSNVLTIGTEAGGTGVKRLTAIHGFAKAGGAGGRRSAERQLRADRRYLCRPDLAVFQQGRHHSKGPTGMSNPVSFINTYTQNIVQFCSLMQTLRGNNDQLAQDPSLIDRYFATENPNNPNISLVRTDIVAQDVKDAQAALVQMLFTYDSGAPTQKSMLFKMLP